MRTLIAFDAAGAPQLTVTASVEREGADRLCFRYRLSGAMDHVLVPRPGSAHFADHLWQNTCFEAFVRHPGEGAYLEAGSLWLCLSVDPKAADAVRCDYSHIAFDVVPDDFATLSDAVSGVATVWRDNRSEGDSLYVLDPDGHRIELHVGDLNSRLDHYRQRLPPVMVIE